MGYKTLLFSSPCKLYVRNSQLVYDTENDDEKLTDYLWGIVKEIIKTNIENKQNIIIEGCYIPFDWKKYFSEEYLKEIQYVCLIMTEEYINSYYNDIKKYSNIINTNYNLLSKIEGLSLYFITLFQTL